MPKIVANFPPDPTAQIDDPDLKPVSQTFWATVGGVEVARENALPMSVTACQPFAVSPGVGGPGVDVLLNLTYADADGQVSDPALQTVHVDGVTVPPAPKVNIPPKAPGDFGGVTVLPDTP